MTTHPFPSKASGDGDARRVPISKQLVLSLLASLRLPYVLVRRDGRKEGVEQVLPVGLRSGQDFEAEAAEKPADEGADDASHEHSLRHLQQLHLQRYQVQLPQGRSHLRVFYFKCTKCSAELTIKTEPQNSDYVVESGASRNFEPWGAKDEADKGNQKRETEEMADAMKSLENRTLDSKREMDILAAVDEVKSMRSRQATIKVDAMLEILQRSAKEKEPREVVRRIDDDNLDDDEDLFQISTDNAETSNNNSKGEMGERKVLNKYYPSDFNTGKIPRRRQPKNQQMKVRMMLPMSIRCGTCSNYIYKGTKFNSRKEEVISETYSGIQIFRFYFKCTKCSAELTIKTDPQNSYYVVESGASRNFEPWRAKDEEADKEKQKRDIEEMADAMKSLATRTLDSKREMDILAALDEVKSMRSRQATIKVDAMLEVLQRSAEEKEKKLEEEDEALIKSLFGRRKVSEQLPLCMCNKLATCHAPTEFSKISKGEHESKRG
ncbi:unnamed protein product [Camellia sinensis]